MSLCHKSIHWASKCCAFVFQHIKIHVLGPFPMDVIAPWIPDDFSHANEAR